MRGKIIQLVLFFEFFYLNSIHSFENNNKNGATVIIYGEGSLDDYSKSIVCLQW